MLPDPLDRRVRMVDEGEDGVEKRVSDLRTEPFVVLLGEPGIGKSRVLEEEAEHAGTSVVTVRDIIGGFVKPTGDLFLDALDECRSDGGERDKVSTLARYLIDVNADRWRLSCRAEDWREASDLGLLRKAAGARPITVAKLVPLDTEEALTVLANLGAEDPEKFLLQALRMGADSFTTSPLSLRLLHAATASGGDWPASRFELFERAVQQLAEEQDEERSAATLDRPPVHSIIEAAGAACLALLASDVVAIARRTGVQASGETERREIDASLLGFEAPLRRTVLGSALFRGDGRAFEPCHKVVAEFLGAKSLAARVTAKDQALPFGRALALITAPDGKAPTELRGLYAWFASHLAKLGRPDLASAMIDRDALTVLHYGDVASMPVDICRKLLDSLGRDDPFFLNSWGYDAGTAGLARDDLEPDLRRMMRDPSESIHRRVTVFAALTNGRPVSGLVPDLREMVLDQDLASADRTRALDAWLNAVPPESEERAELFREVGQHTASLTREIIRIQLFSALPDRSFDADGIRSVLADYERAEEEKVIGRLWRMRRRLVAAPITELFDVSVSDWRPNGTKSIYRGEVDDLLENSLAAAIASTPTLSADQLLFWLRNASRDDHHQWSETVKTAVQSWMETEPNRETALFMAALDRTPGDPSEAVRAARHEFINSVDRMPSDEVLQATLARHRKTDDENVRARLVRVMCELGRIGNVGADVFEQIYEVLCATDDRDALQRLTTSKIDEYWWKYVRRLLEEKRKAAITREKKIRGLEPQLEAVRQGQHAEACIWAAHHLREAAGDNDDAEAAALERLVSESNEAVAVAALEGLQNAIGTLPDGLTIERMASAGNRHPAWECTLVVGVEQRLAFGSMPAVGDLPELLPLVVLRSILFLNESARKDAVRQWIWNAFGEDAEAARTRLATYWSAAIAQGEHHLSCVPQGNEDLGKGQEVFVQAATDILGRPNLPDAVVEDLTRGLLGRLGSEELSDLATKAIGQATMGSRVHQIWSSVLFGCDPVGQAGQLSDLDLAVSLIGNERSFARQVADEADRTNELTEVVIEQLGPLVAPDDLETDENGEPNGVKSAASQLVTNLIRGMGSDAAGCNVSKLSEYAKQAHLQEWQPQLKHAIAQQAAIHRDATFSPPRPEAVIRTLSLDAPANAADLHAVIADELRRLQREIRHLSSTPRKMFWNTDKYERSIDPKVENVCRDVLLNTIAPRLERYNVAAITPEGQAAEGRRADAITFGSTGEAVPIEAKRHYHQDVWTAASEQLQTYTADPRARGFGVYVVFWFGTDVQPVPSPPDGLPQA